MAGWALLAIALSAAAVALWPRAENSMGLIEQPAGETDVAIDPEAETKAGPARDTSAKVDTAAGEVGGVESPQPAVMPPRPARLTVLIYPWGSVWIDGKPKGSAPLKNESLKPGRYKIGAGQDGPLQTRTVRLREGQRKTIRFDLTE